MQSPRLKEWLTRLAPIYPGEGAVVGLCFAVNFLVVAGIMFGRNARDSLFLVYFGVQYLPYMYFANALFLVLCSLAYTSLVDRIERGRFLGGLSLLFVTSLVLSRLILVPHPHWFFPVLYLVAQFIWYFSLMQFWTFVGDLFDTRQAKRLFPFLAVGALLGMIGVGLGSRAIVHGLGTENLLLVWAGLIFAAAVLGGIAFQRYRPLGEAPNPDVLVARARARPSEWQKIKEGIGEVGREPLQRSLAGYILMMWTVYAIVDFCFNKTMRAKYPDPNDLTTFFGRFIGTQGFLCLIVQLFFTRAVISALGVGTSINFHPVFLLAGTAWMSLRYGFSSVLTAKLGDATMLYTFSDSSYQLLYNPIARERRARVRGLIEGYIRPLSLAAAGGLVLAGNSYLKPFHVWGREIVTGQELSWGALSLSVFWLGFALTAKKGYIRALLETLQRGSPALRQSAATALSKLNDPASLSILVETLRSESPERVVAAAKFLESLGTEDVAPALAELLGHPDPRVRATAASALGRRGGGKYSEQLTRHLEDPDPRVRANVIEALAAVHDPALAEKLQPLLQDASARARVNSVLTLAAVKGVSTAIEWLPLIRNMAQHSDPDTRASATYALGRLPAEESIDLLIDLLNDADLRIRCQAAQALGHIGSPRVVPHLIEALAGPADLRRVARRSLVAVAQRYGEAVGRELAMTALRSNRPEIRSELADVLGRLKDPRVPETLVELLKDPEWRVCWKVLKSFERLARHGPLPENARAALFDYARIELKAFRQSVLFSQVLVAEPKKEAERVLAEALEDDRVNIEERVFHMLGILCGRDRMLAIFNKLNSRDARARADALEALDTLGPKELAREILGLLEPSPLAAGAAKEPPESVLTALAHHPKPWMRACTAFYLGVQAGNASESLLKALVGDHDHVVRETALYAGWQAFRDGWRAEVEAATQSSDLALRRTAHRIIVEGTNGADAGHLSTPRSEPMLLTIEKALFLKSALLFAGLEGEELAALADIALEHEFEPGEIIFEANQPAHHLYLIVRGKVEVYLRTDSAERSLAVIGEREIFGEMAILDDEPRSASVRALEPTLVLKIDRASFRELIQERPQISFAIFKILSSRLRQRNLEPESLHTLDTGRHYA